MKASDYQKQVLVTESRNFSKDSLIGKMITFLYNKVHKDTLSYRLIQKRNIRLLHSAKGIMTEVGELFEMLEKPQLDLTNLREEVSDRSWYIAITTDELQLSLESLVSKAQEETKLLDYSGLSEANKRDKIRDLIIEASKTSAQYLDILKKGVFYGREMSVEKISALLLTMMIQDVTLLKLGGFDIESAFDINIAKLQKKRFKTGKFTANEAVNRNLEEERKALEGKS